MWSDKDLLDIVKMFLPHTSKIILFETPSQRPAVELIDLDGDNILELAGAYYWQGEIYIIILKYYDSTWHVLDTVKGKGYNITYFEAYPIISKYKNNLIVGWQVGAIWSDLSVYELVDKELKDLINGKKYFSKIEMAYIGGDKERNGTYEVALWIHDTGEAYKVEIYRWLNNKFELALDVYPYYFEKVANYYKKVLKEKDSTTYWYYLADAQIKTGNTKEACQSIDKALASQYPYPSIEELMKLKKQICEDRQLYNQHGIELGDFRMIKSTNQAIIDVEVGNILGQYTHDKVILVGHYLYEDSSYVENVDIVINPEESGTSITTQIPYTGYNLELFLGDFNGDERDEIMVRGEYGGSGGYAIAAIYEYKDGHLVEIFNPDMFSEKDKLIAKYIEDYKVLVQSVTSKEKYTFDISKTPKIYLNMIYDENGKAKGAYEPTISAINGAFPIKIVFKKNYYLFIRQRVVGVSNADTIGYIESFVNLLNNDIKVIEMGAYHFGEERISMKRI